MTEYLVTPLYTIDGTASTGKTVSAMLNQHASDGWSILQTHVVESDSPYEKKVFFVMVRHGKDV